MEHPEQIKVIISDCHISAGKFYDGNLNPHEDFKFDQELCEFIRYFSNNEYLNLDVELFLNGDFLDFLNVPFFGEFEDAITEEISVTKLTTIIEGHPELMKALKNFVSLPKKKISYLVGNHDPDLFFPLVREKLVRTWDPEGNYPSDKIRIITDTDRVRFDGGIEIHHGNQFEAVHVLDFKNPTLNSYLDKPVLNLPWSSFYVLKIVNRLKWERDYLDKVRPIKLFLLFGLLTDPWFILKYLFLTIFYFTKTIFFYDPGKRSNLKETIRIIKDGTAFFRNLEAKARNILDTEKDVKTVIFGHSHKPTNRIYPDNKRYINTGTWTKMINLDIRNLGSQYCLTFAFVRIKDNQAECELRHWIGEYQPHKPFNY